ncbi:unnamed protein product [Aphanomyces euteiches]
MNEVRSFLGELSNDLMGFWQWVAILVLVGACFFFFAKPPALANGAATGATPNIKRKAKKKSKKKKSTDTSKPLDTTDSNSEQPLLGESKSEETADAVPPTIQDYFAESDSDDDDDGLSAAQILSQKHFGTVMLGGSKKLRPTALELQLTEGQRVLARFKKQDEWFPGTVAKVQRGNLYIIHYDDGAVESKVPIQYIRVTNDSDKASTDDGAADAEDDDDDEEDEDEDSVVEDNEWQVVTSAKSAPTKKAEAPATSHPSGLTKKQRESRRRKEKLKEQKELMRSQAQESGLHARWGGTKNTWRAPS